MCNEGEFFFYWKTWMYIGSNLLIYVKNWSWEDQLMMSLALEFVIHSIHLTKILDSCWDDFQIYYNVLWMWIWYKKKSIAFKVTRLGYDIYLFPPKPHRLYLYTDIKETSCSKRNKEIFFERHALTTVNYNVEYVYSLIEEDNY